MLKSQRQGSGLEPALHSPRGIDMPRAATFVMGEVGTRVTVGSRR